MEVSHIPFVDDLFLFGEAFESQAGFMDAILRRFSAHSGQKINVGKSKLFVSKNVSGTLAQASSRKWEIPLTTDLRKCLGMPVLHEQVTNHTYSGVVIKV